MTEIQPFNVELPAIPTPSPEEAKKLLQPQDFLQNIKLCHGQSDEVTLGKCGAGHFWFQPYDLGKTVTVVAICYRWHAILFENNQKTLESFDYKSEVTKQIRALRRIENRVMPRHGYSWLVFIPQVNDFGIIHPAIPSQWGAGWDMYQFFTPPEKRDETSKDLPHTRIWIVSTIDVTKPPKHKRLVVSAGTQKDIEKFDAPDKKKLQEAVDKFYTPVKLEPKIKEGPTVER